MVELTDGNFEKLVLGSDDLWLVEFFAPWCGHCKNLAPHWAQAASELKGKVKLGALDATVHTIMANKFGVGAERDELALNIYSNYMLPLGKCSNIIVYNNILYNN